MKLLIAIALAFLWVPATAQAQSSSDIPQWYGTIRFSKTLTQHTDDPEEFRARPGKKFSDVKVTWSGTMRFLPGNKAVVVAKYTLRRELDARFDQTRPCHWKDGTTAYHDYENLLEVRKVPVNREEKNRLLFRLGSDGAYRASVIVGGGQHQPRTLKVRTWREFYSECSKPHRQRNDQNSDGSTGMESLTLAHVEGKAKPGATTLTGSWKSADDDKGDLSYSWDLTLAEPQLVARAKATPSPVVRGESVTLDANDSTGKIDKYEWQFTPDGDCQMTPEATALKLTGRSVTFKALCDFTAELTVSNGKASDRAWQPVAVEARKGEAWTMKFKANDGGTFNRRVTADLIHAGVNQCTPHATDEITGHWIHTNAPNNKTWRGSGYVLAQVQDSGPFRDAWFVQSQSLNVDRQERVNAEILPGGAIYKLNVSRGNQRDVNDWGVQVKAHETTHSALVKEAYEGLGPDGDPAVRIEKLVGGMGEEAFQAIVDMNVREIETVFHEAAAEDKVANRLRANSSFARDIHIWVPGSSGDFKKPMGPLWKIGD